MQMSMYRVKARYKFPWGKGLPTILFTGREPDVQHGAIVDNRVHGPCTRSLVTPHYSVNTARDRIIARLGCVLIVVLLVYD